MRRGLGCAFLYAMRMIDGWFFVRCAPLCLRFFLRTLVKSIPIETDRIAVNSAERIRA